MLGNSPEILPCNFLWESSITKDALNVAQRVLVTAAVVLMWNPTFSSAWLNSLENPWVAGMVKDQSVSAEPFCHYIFPSSVLLNSFARELVRLVLKRMLCYCPNCQNKMSYLAAAWYVVVFRVFFKEKMKYVNLNAYNYHFVIPISNAIADAGYILNFGVGPSKYYRYSKEHKASPSALEKYYFAYQ